MEEKVLIVRGDEITTLYSDDVRELGTVVRVERASNVEYDNRRGGWTVQLADGMYLATAPPHPADGIAGYITSIQHHAHIFTTRDEALAAEVAFIQARL